MIRPLIYFMIIIIIFLVGFIAGIERDSTEQRLEFREINVAEQTVNEEEMPEQLSGESIKGQSMVNDDSDHLLAKFAYLCEAITHKFYQMIILVLYNFSELFI